MIHKGSSDYQRKLRPQITVNLMTHREYFYTIDTRGNLIHDGGIIDDPVFLDFFYRRLQSNNSGAHADYLYYSPCGPEWNYVAEQDTPIVFRSLNDGCLGYGGTLTVPFAASNLRFGANGVLYHTAPVGTWGRLHANVTLELSKHIEPWGPWYAYIHPDSGHYDVIPPLDGDARYRLLSPLAGNACAGCGQDNPFSLRLSFLFDTEQRSAHTWLRPSVQLMGSLNVMHGGFVALLMDETMGKVLRGCEVKAPTAQLNVRYRKPVPIGELLHVQASLVRAEGRKHFLHATVTRADNSEAILAECEALFIRIA
jgi:acyl-coenzyme A thioesterase PaaI-like protein